MAKRPNRYAEARLCLASGSVGMLLLVFSVLAVKDRALLSGNAVNESVAETGSANALVLSVPTSTPAPSARPGAVATETDATAEPTPAPTAATAAPTSSPQTRSGGS